MSWIKTVVNDIEDQLEAMITRQKKLEGYLNRVVYGQYQKAKAEEWESEGKSQKHNWKALNKAYKTQKLIRFADFPGAGQHMLIATGSLVSSVIGPSQEWTVFSVSGTKKDHKKLVDKKTLEVSTTNKYAEYVNDAREFVGLNYETEKEIAKGIAEYMFKGNILGVK